MKVRTGAFAIVLRLFLVLFFAHGSLAAAPQGELFDQGVAAYRRGAYAEAETLWRRTLEIELPDADRARVLYNLGNAAMRLDEALQAVGWYTACIRLAPRDADAWRNLELARAEAGLEPADRGDLRSTLRRLLSALRPDEARTASLLALVLFAALALGEAFFGGRLWKRLLGLGAVVLALSLVPWAYGLLAAKEDPVIALRAPTAKLYSEPREASATVAEVQAGEEAERIDALPGWVRLQKTDGSRGWVREEAVLPLLP